MPEFIPLSFAGYDWRRPELQPDLVTAPPYDVLSPEQRDELAAKSPYNLVHVDMPRSYAQAGEILTQWVSQGVIRKKDEPEFAALASRYVLQGREYVRWGFMGGLRLASWGKEGVYPHEQTYPKAKTDRLELMRATNAQLSPIFGIFDHQDSQLQTICDLLNDQPPTATMVTEDEVEHRLWSVPREYNEVIRQALENTPVYIADGHHRYETALHFAQHHAGPALEPGTMGHRPADYVFACLCNIATPGVEILPYHRMVRGSRNHSWPDVLQQAETWFHIRQAGTSNDLEQSILPSASLLTLPDKMWLLELKPEFIAQCDPLFQDVGAYVLDTFLFRKSLGLTEEDLSGGGHLAYTPFIDHAVASVVYGESQAALLLKAVDMNVLRRVSESGRVMPRKSTFFYPKLPGGLLFHLLG
ncbi:Uncharacterized conserved protein, DUF1015 family [Desulfonatronum thiosulfatophilum]|uniref:Uncharacterized conserved protein, DUF1015 family n=1 Tax=Desulfonatronum thiosulfatophilum TaxID=617002 RepID=A0A1G6DCJ7_9BACT|nr:DUF1015 domain-containing protein [Desulfonatronum thiosulfatophilum]SDB42840.1 Uncharacterized conserved protein, DUF1015 family [Desulfonatronum thiosulfatophilum]